jgi:hypothetical protein
MVLLFLLDNDLSFGVDFYDLVSFACSLTRVTYFYGSHGGWVQHKKCEQVDCIWIPSSGFPFWLLIQLRVKVTANPHRPLRTYELERHRFSLDSDFYQRGATAKSSPQILRVDTGVRTRHSPNHPRDVDFSIFTCYCYS